MNNMLRKLHIAVATPQRAKGAAVFSSITEQLPGS